MGAVMFLPDEDDGRECEEGGSRNWGRGDWKKELRDSKKLSAARRESLAKVIRARALVGIGWVGAEEIDEMGMSRGIRAACVRACRELGKRLREYEKNTGREWRPEIIVIDGTVNFLKEVTTQAEVTTLVRAEDAVREVAAASIVAKVARDKYMQEIGEQFPGYGFEKHVGYGTARHLQALKELGPCTEHRFSVRPVAEVAEQMGVCRRNGIVGAEGKVSQTAREEVEWRQKEDGTTVAQVQRGRKGVECGREAERVVAEWLVREDHVVVARNFRRKNFEIDIVSVRGGEIFFTEVRYRSGNYQGGGRESVTARKLVKMRKGAEGFLAEWGRAGVGCDDLGDDMRKEFGWTGDKEDLEPKLAVAEVIKGIGGEMVVREWIVMK